MFGYCRRILCNSARHDERARGRAAENLGTNKFVRQRTFCSLTTNCAAFYEPPLLFGEYLKKYLHDFLDRKEKLRGSCLTCHNILIKCVKEMSKLLLIVTSVDKSGVLLIDLTNNFNKLLSFCIQHVLYLYIPIITI